MNSQNLIITKESKSYNCTPWFHQLTINHGSDCAFLFTKTNKLTMKHNLN